MKIIILTLLFGLLGYTISKPLNSRDATDALVDHWHTSALQAWPIQPLAYSTPGLNLLTPGQVQQSGARQNFQISAIAPPPPQATTNFAGFVVPQYFPGQQQQYFSFHNGFYNTPFNQNVYTTGQQYLPQFVTAVPTVSQKFPNNGEKDIKTTTTKKPNIKDREPTTRKPQTNLHFKPPKLEVKPEKLIEAMADFKNDVALLRAVEKINPEYVIEEIINVPGKHVYSTKETERKFTKNLHFTNDHQKTNNHLSKKSLTQKQMFSKTVEPISSGIKVEATGRTSTKGNIPEIPFGTYFLPYFSQNQTRQQQSGKKIAALILEPHSKAVVGNGGTAISTPISKAYLKRGVTTNVYFNPESVAIAGVGGKAHAQADLELDLIN